MNTTMTTNHFTKHAQELARVKIVSGALDDTAYACRAKRVVNAQSADCLLDKHFEPHGYEPAKEENNNRDNEIGYEANHAPQQVVERLLQDLHPRLYDHMINRDC